MTTPYEDTQNWARSTWDNYGKDANRSSDQAAAEYWTGFGDTVANLAGRAGGAISGFIGEQQPTIGKIVNETVRLNPYVRGAEWFFGTGPTDVWGRSTGAISDLISGVRTPGIISQAQARAGEGTQPGDRPEDTPAGPGDVGPGGDFQIGSAPSEGDIAAAEAAGQADMAERMRLQREAWIEQANRWADDLLSDAQGDKDFAIRKLDAYHKVALGQNDAERAKFLEEVSDKLEERIGTIPYDYKRGITRLEENKQRALERLAKDETELRRQFGVETTAARRGQGEALSQRGLLTGPRLKTVGLGGEEVGRLEDEIAARFATLERSVTEPKEDITREALRTREDLAKTARRGGLEVEREFKFGTEEQERLLEQRRKAIERQREERLDLAEAAQFLGAA